MPCWLLGKGKRCCCFTWGVHISRRDCSIRLSKKCLNSPKADCQPLFFQSVNTDMLRHFRQIRTQTTRGKENSEIRSSAVTTIGKKLLLFTLSSLGNCVVFYQCYSTIDTCHLCSFALCPVLNKQAGCWYLHEHTTHCLYKKKVGKFKVRFFFPETCRGMFAC